MIEVLRLGHRPLRDKRITTHVGLVARAFGADGLVMTVDDEKVVGSIRKVVENWGGEFHINVIDDWMEYVKGWRGEVVHLTMYGVPLEEGIKKIRSKDVLILVGSGKVPREAFEMADQNISVGNQPHSEVSALAIFLDRLSKGKALQREFAGKLKIVPSEREKIIQKI